MWTKKFKEKHEKLTQIRLFGHLGFSDGIQSTPVGFECTYWKRKQEIYAINLIFIKIAVSKLLCLVHIISPNKSSRSFKYVWNIQVTTNNGMTDRHFLTAWTPEVLSLLLCLPPERNLSSHLRYIGSPYNSLEEKYFKRSKWQCQSGSHLSKFFPNLISFGRS